MFETPCKTKHSQTWCVSVLNTKEMWTANVNCEVIRAHSTPASDQPLMFQTEENTEKKPNVLDLAFPCSQCGLDRVVSGWLVVETDKQKSKANMWHVTCGERGPINRKSGFFFECKQTHQMIMRWNFNCAAKCSFQLFQIAQCSKMQNAQFEFTNWGYKAAKVGKQALSAKTVSVRGSAWQGAQSRELTREEQRK